LGRVGLKLSFPEDTFVCRHLSFADCSLSDSEVAFLASGKTVSTRGHNDCSVATLAELFSLIARSLAESTPLFGKQVSGICWLGVM
jgi:hypothetical protein